MAENKMIIGINEKPPIAKWIILAIQHVFAMFGATILVPILVNLFLPEEKTAEDKPKTKKEKVKATVK